ncbi:MAG: hypothetical protein GF401_10670 [Chitinivibrionales bacterium]|nr:hypothetical protein [Chitinivibrionales bacterium]
MIPIVRYKLISGSGLSTKHWQISSIRRLPSEGNPSQKLNELRTLAFVERKENIVLMGPSNLGKSHLLYALDHLACVEGHTTYHITGSQLKEDFSRAKEQNRLRRKLKALCKPRLLAIGEAPFFCFFIVYGAVEDTGAKGEEEKVFFVRE